MAAPTIRHDRYRLDDFVRQDSNRQTWRAYDLVLNRVVGIQIVSRQHQNFDQIHRAAHQAGAVVDRRIVRVIDVVSDTDDLCIVSEWVEGLTLDEFIHTQLTPQHSVALTQSVVEAICALGRTDLDRRANTKDEWGHGRITPQSIIVSPSGEVRLRGHLVQAAIHGTVHGASVPQEDIASVGAVLQACLTEAWPAPINSQLEPSPSSGVDYALPGQLRAWLPKSIDDFVARTRIGPNQHQHINDVRLELLSIKHELPEDSVTTFGQGSDQAPGRSRLVRLGIGVAASVVVLGVVGFGAVAVFQGTGSEQLASDVPAPYNDAATVQQFLAGEGDAVSAGSSPSVADRALPIVAAWGVGEKRHPLSSTETGALAHDSDIATGWRTQNYRSPNVSRNKVDGLLIDLGSNQAISAFDLELAGLNSDIVITTGTLKQLTSGKGAVFAKIDGAPDQLITRVARPVSARYALIRFTKVPLGANGYQGGILTLKVLGP